MKNVTINLFRNTGERKQYADGEIIFQAGQVGDAMYVVLSGEVEVWQNGNQLARVVIRR